MNLNIRGYDCYTCALGYCLGTELRSFYQTVKSPRYLDASDTGLINFFNCAICPSTVAITSFWRLHSALVGEHPLLRRSSILLLSKGTLDPGDHSISNIQTKFFKAHKWANRSFIACMGCCLISEHLIAFASRDPIGLRKVRLVNQNRSWALLNGASLITVVASAALIYQKCPLMPLALASGIALSAGFERYQLRFYQKRILPISKLAVAFALFPYNKFLSATIILSFLHQRALSYREQSDRGEA